MWIDHRKAVIAIVLLRRRNETNRIGHGETCPLFRRGRSESGDRSGEDQRDRQFTDHLNRYYDEVISDIRDAESILIFGPGEAKGELKTRLESKKLGERIVAVETVDKMTDPQIAAKVRQYFQK